MRPLSTLIFTFLSLFLPSTLCTAAPSLLLRVPPHLPALPPTTRATLTTHNHTLRAPVTRANTFVFDDLSYDYSALSSLPSQSGTSSAKRSYLLDIACRDYDFLSYGVDVWGDEGKVEVYRVKRGGVEIGGRERVGEGGFMVGVVRAREYYEERAGFSPLSLLQNPMILIAVVGLAFVVGMPYLMDSMDPEMRKEFEEQQKKSILSGGANTQNPLQNFDMAAWMAGKTAGTSGREQRSDGGGAGPGSGGNVRRRG